MQVTLPLNKMTVPEKLRALEDIWDNLRQTEEDVPSPEWHREILQEREQRIQEGKAKFIGLDEAKYRVRNQVK